ncbi:FKBP-type peptidyl-prolyl cis-trans isomerase [uncultured Bacteroides sp.]|uniref:FKBP-type peptidyl-prolyl cis-trans isomerase n=1 Tax=uncultured Bacteroides sp. TaxID=162156 RepID=UPI002621D0AE|nr:FKBP-type peptidyl-prolyl cis-trans isomerase [uncultured Bacteroides sp.]
MKKSTLLLVFAATAGLASCTAQGPKPNMKTDIDSLSYMMGVTGSDGLKEFALNRLEIDSTDMANFIRGIQQGVKDVDAKDKAYMEGVAIGLQLSKNFKMTSERMFHGDTTKTLSKENFLAGFFANINNKSLITPDSANLYIRTKLNEIETQAREKEAAELRAKYADYIKKNEDFLAANKTKEGVQVTESGLQYKILKKGTGEIPTKNSRVKVNYKGTLIDGTQFDSSYDRKEPATIPIYQVVKGWQEALTMMPVGSKWEIYIPAELGYKDRETAGGKIKPFSTLIFTVELVGIEK